MTTDRDHRMAAYLREMARRATQWADVIEGFVYVPPTTRPVVVEEEGE